MKDCLEFCTFCTYFCFPDKTPCLLDTPCIFEREISDLQFSYILDKENSTCYNENVNKEKEN